MTDLINDTHKGSPLLYLRDDKLKETLNNFFLVYKNFENQILENATDNNLGIADIRCILVILLYPGITCLLYTSPSPRDLSTSRMPSSA